MNQHQLSIGLKRLKPIVLILLLQTSVLKIYAQPGANDPSFNPSGTGSNSVIQTVIPLSDGKILIGGGFISFNGTAINKVARLNNDGTLDGSFNPGSGASTNGNITAVAVQSDGKIVIAGDFAAYNGTTRSRVARINSNGSLDFSFDPGMGIGGQANAFISAYTVVLQPNGKMLIAGEFTTYNGTSRNRIVRVNADGSIDATFNPGTGTDGTIYSVILQSDGKILLVGTFSTYNGTSRNNIARVNSDGSLDVTFTPGTGANNTILSAVQLPDGKFVIGGAFTIYNSTSINRIARLNTDGTLDVTFLPGMGAGGASIYSVALQSDSKLLIAGAFTSYNGTGRNRIARINSDGSLDAGFDPGTGVNNTLYSVNIQTDGKILIGGQFATYNGITKNGVARIIGSISTLPVTLESLKAIVKQGSISLEWQVQNETNLLAYEIEKSSAGAAFQTMTAQRATGSMKYSWDDLMVAAGTYYYRLKMINRNGSIQYSSIVKVSVERAPGSFSICPNPIVNNSLNVQFVNKPAGVYTLNLFNAAGQNLFKRQLIQAAGSSNENIALPDLKVGQYFLKINEPGGDKVVIPVLIQK